MVNTSHPFCARSEEEAQAHLTLHQYGAGEFKLVCQKPKIYMFFFVHSYTAKTLKVDMFLPTEVPMSVKADEIIPPTEQKSIKSCNVLYLKPPETIIDTVKADLVKIIEEEKLTELNSIVDASITKLLSCKLPADDIMIGRSMKQQFCSLRPNQCVTTNESNILKRGGVLKITQVHAMKPDLLVLCLPSGGPRNDLPTGLVAFEVDEEEQQQHVNAKAGAEETKTKTMPLAQLFGGMEKAGGEIIHHLCTQGNIVDRVDIYGMIADYQLSKCKVWKLELSFNDTCKSTRFEGVDLLDLDDAWNRFNAVLL